MIKDKKNPGAAATASEASKINTLPKHVTDDNNPAIKFKQCRDCGKRKLYVEYKIYGHDIDLGIAKGRNGWALLELHNAGKEGCTPIDNPAPRWSAYVFNLRQDGVPIETIHEAHKGSFPGTHARYVLSKPIKIISIAGNDR